MYLSLRVFTHLGEVSNATTLSILSASIRENANPQEELSEMQTGYSGSQQSRFHDAGEDTGDGTGSDWN